MKITLSNQIEISTTLKKQQQIIERFTFANPKYADAVTFCRSTREIDRLIELWKFTDSGIVIPMGTFEYLLQTFKPEIIDQRTTVKANIPFAGTLRPYQEQFINTAITG